MGRGGDLDSGCCRVAELPHTNHESSVPASVRGRGHWLPSVSLGVILDGSYVESQVLKVIKHNILFSNKTVIYLSRSIFGNVGGRDTW